jgi:ParB-like chromosome segregation protein Spo0J
MSDERAQAVRRLAAQGLNDREIGGELGLTKNAVYKIRSKNGIAAGKPLAVSPEVLSMVRSMAAQGAQDGEIAQAIGMNKDAVWAVRRRHGIEAGNPPDYHRHGTIAMYDRGCRCNACKDAEAQKKRKSKHSARERLQKGEAEIEHGKLSSYYYWGCRCEACCQAATRVSGAYRTEAQAESLAAATNYGKQWTGPELEIAARDDLTTKEVAAMLGRSFAAVVNMRRLLRCDPKTITFAGIPEQASTRSARPDEDSTT